AYCSKIRLNRRELAERGAGNTELRLAASGGATRSFSLTHLRISSMRAFSMGSNSSSAVNCRSPVDSAESTGNKRGRVRFSSIETTSSTSRRVADIAVPSARFIFTANVSSQRSYLTVSPTTAWAASSRDFNSEIRIATRFVSPLTRSFLMEGGRFTAQRSAPNAPSAIVGTNSAPQQPPVEATSASSANSNILQLIHRRISVRRMHGVGGDEVEIHRPEALRFQSDAGLRSNIEVMHAEDMTVIR